MASYNEIISILDQFATAHYQIKAFGNGEMDELVETFSLKDAENVGERPTQYNRNGRRNF
jgi:hypothetical protein